MRSFGRELKSPLLTPSPLFGNRKKKKEKKNSSQKGGLGAAVDFSSLLCFPAAHNKSSPSLCAGHLNRAVQGDLLPRAVQVQTPALVDSADALRAACQVPRWQPATTSRLVAAHGGISPGRGYSSENPSLHGFLACRSCGMPLSYKFYVLCLKTGFPILLNCIKRAQSNLSCL